MIDHRTSPGRLQAYPYASPGLQTPYFAIPVQPFILQKDFLTFLLQTIPSLQPLKPLTPDRFTKEPDR